MIHKYTILEKHIPRVITQLREQNMIPLFDYIRENCKKTYITHFKLSKLQENYSDYPFAIKLSSFGYNITHLKALYALNSKLYVDAESLKTLRKDNEFIYKCWDNNLHIGKTYQMYRKSAFSELKNDLRFYGNNFPIKLVRGAYYHSDSGIKLFPTKADTDEQYNNSIKWLQDNDIKNVLYATHNEHSLSLLKENSNIAHLYGVRDDLSKKYAQNNTVYKYVPFGKYHETLPYLFRRLMENRSMIGHLVI